MGSKKADELMKEESKLDMTPIIDVTFNLLIFFMCTLKFKTLEGKLVSYLPTDRGLSSKQEDVMKEDVEIILKVPKSDWAKPAIERTIEFQRNGSATPFGRCVKVAVDPQDPKKTTIVYDPPNTPDLIKKYMTDVRARSPESKAKINAYARCPHLHVVNILNMMIEAEFTEISYSGIPNTLVKDLQSGEIK